MVDASAHALPYPVRIDGRLDPSLSRWLWLVKWLLALPHYLLLAFLWVAFAVVSVVAFFAILVTGRYPRALFDFNVGVLRWSWRVAYYTYGALGTDRYPPFSLSAEPDYPATFDVAYPEHLSRGLVLVKWWLLALPHYLVVGILAGGGLALAQTDRNGWQVGGGGLIGLLVLIAAVALAVTGSYPRSLFDLVLGLNRWVLRVAAYAALMTDRYPPFRLDMGGQDPGSVLVGEPPSAAGAGSPPSPPAEPSGRWGAGRVVTLVAGSLAGVLALAMLGGGAAALVADRSARDDAGMLTSDVQAFGSAGSAVVAEDIRLDLAGPDWTYARRLVGDVRLRVTGTGSAPVFVGVGPEAQVRDYLAGVAYDDVRDVGDGDVTYRSHAGGPPEGAPAAQDFWTRSASGSGTQTLTWAPESGRWSVVMMNADGSAGVAVDADVAAELPVLPAVAAWLLVAGAVLLAGSAVLIVLAARSRP